MYNSLFLLATTKSTTSSSSSGSSIFSFVLLALLLGFGYYMLAVRPKKMASKDKEKIAQFQVGDNIVTTAGIVGIIKNITDTRVFVEVSDGVVLEMYKQALFHKVEENLLNSSTNDDEIENTEDDSTTKPEG